MMGFVDHDPVRPARPRAHLLESRQQRGEERGAVAEGQRGRFTPTCDRRASPAARAPLRPSGARSPAPISRPGPRSPRSRPRDRRCRTGSPRRHQPLDARRSRPSILPLPEGPAISSIAARTGAMCTAVPSPRVPSRSACRASRDSSAGRPRPSVDQLARRRRRRAPRVTRSARSLSAGSAFATATPHSHSSRTRGRSRRRPPPTALCGESAELLERGGQAGRLVHAGRQHHHGALVEDHLQLQPELADRFEHGDLVRLPGRHDHAADRRAARRRAPAQLLRERGRRRLGQQPPPRVVAGS